MENVCSQCGVRISDAEILYTTQGAAVCMNCNVQGEIKESERRAAANVPQSAGSAFLTGFVARSIVILVLLLAALLVAFLRHRS